MGSEKKWAESLRSMEGSGSGGGTGQGGFSADDAAYECGAALREVLRAAQQGGEEECAAADGEMQAQQPSARIARRTPVGQS